MLSKTSTMLLSLAPPDLKQLSRQQKVELMQQCRASQTHNPNLVLFLATDILAGGASGLGGVELYEVYESVLIASLECGKIDNARNYLNLLEKKFGRKSTRVSHLRGLCYEAEGNVAEARKVYETLLHDVPTDDFPVKRLSAMCKSGGDYAGAIRVLHDSLVYTDEDGTQHRYLDVHRGDSLTTYRELSNLCYLVGDLERAVYYAEEVVLFGESSYVAHTALAELCFARKDYARSVSAYAQSLRINQHANNTRAAYGLLQAAKELSKQLSTATATASATSVVGTSASSTQPPYDGVKLRALCECAIAMLRSMYAGSATLSALDAFLQREW